MLLDHCQQWARISQGVLTRSKSPEGCKAEVQRRKEPTVSNASSLSVAQQFGAVWPQCVARAWQDPQFREALKRDPAGTLLESYQFTVPAGITLQVVETSDTAPQHPQANALRMAIPPAPELEVREVALYGAGVDQEMKVVFTAC
jgi:ribosomally synthesized peptide (two-chain TOMM family)